MSFKLPDPIKYLIRLLETFRKAIEKKLTGPTVNLLVLIVAITVSILSSQIIVVFLLIKVLEL